MTIKEFVKKRPLRGDMTESSSSKNRAPSKPPKDVLELGTYLVNELSLDPGVDTLGRWLAHHLAEVMAEVDTAKTSSARRQALFHASRLILKIWEHRTSLPGNAYPLTPYKDLLRIIKTLDPQVGPWQRQSTNLKSAAAIYDSLCRLVIGLLIADTVEAGVRARVRSAKKVRAFLSKEEREILEGLDRWFQALGKRPPNVRELYALRKTDITKILRKLTDDSLEKLRQLSHLLET